MHYVLGPVEVSVYYSAPLDMLVYLWGDWHEAGREKCPERYHVRLGENALRFEDFLKQLPLQ